MERKTWNEKRYYSLDYYLKQTFGEKVYKISLNGGMTCPNRDGKIDTRGCIFCSAEGSGDFAAPILNSVTEQINHGIEGLRQAKSVGNKFIAYFQSFTNTYAPISYLRKLFTEAMAHPDIVALSIATRPDCLDDEILDLLSELNQLKPVWVELGLQTSKEATAIFIRRGYPLSCFEDAVAKLHVRSITIIVHAIVGLPFETEGDILNTMKYISSFPVQGIKLHSLHILKHTDLAEYLDQFHVLTLEEYVDLILICLEHLPQEMVIHRITGDGPKDLLLAPSWSSHKKNVMNQINRRLKEADTWQGRYFKEV